MDLAGGVLRRVLLWGADQHWLRAFATRYPHTRSLAWRFVAGETPETALRAVGELRERGVMATLDSLGESVSDAASARASAEAYAELLGEIGRSGLPSHISLKLTQLGLDLGDDIARENLRLVLERAREVGAFVRIDMEGSAYTERTLALYTALQPEYPRCGVVIQSYLLRSERDIEGLIALGARVRLCKGAYLEPPEVAYQEKADVDASYARLMERLLAEGNYPAVATHDPAMIAHAKRYVRERGIPNGAWEFQMLYGVRRDLQEALAAEGYNVRCYVPFGAAWYPYFMRRLAERPANLGFIVRNLLRERRPLPAPAATR